MVKRFFDLILTTLLLPFALPVIAIFAILVRMTTPGPAFFLQERYGLRGTRFTIYKLRTLYEGTGESAARVTGDDCRITPLGTFLRKSRIDELPQLVNVLKGEMSLVGPRPHSVMTTELALRHEPRYMRRLHVRPGMVGLTQVQKDCYGHTWRRTLLMDRVYIRKQSLCLDLKIMYLSFLVPFRRTTRAASS